ncbi:hypothetical protein Tco_0900186 [Tanacetum coccineum]
MVAFLEKSTGSTGFHQVIDFLNRSHICYALTQKPAVSVSFIKQFWRSAEASTDANGEVKINATVDGHSLSITEGSLRRHLKLADQDGLVVKKLEARVKIGKSRRRAKVVLSEDDEDIADDSSKQGRKLSDAEVQEKVRSAEVNTAGAKQGTASEEVLIVSTTEDEEERKRAMAESKSTKKIDWNDPSVIRYHTLKMKPKTVAQARRNMIKYLKNQGNYKISDFKSMSYDEIRPIFEKVWDFNQHIEPMEHETKKMKSPEKSPEKMKSPEKIVEEDVDTQEEMKEVVKEPNFRARKEF